MGQEILGNVNGAYHALISVHERKHNKAYASNVKKLRFEGGESDEKHVLTWCARMESSYSGVGGSPASM